MSFALVPDWVCRAGLSANALALYTRMALECDGKTRTGFHQHSTMAGWFSCSKRTVQRWLDELVEAGVVEVTGRFDGDQRLSNRYRLPVSRGHDTGVMGVATPVSTYPDPSIQTAAPVESSSTAVENPVEQAPHLPLEPVAADPVTEACQEAAEASGRAERAAGKRISNLRAWARPRAVDYQDRYGATLRERAAQGATVADLAAWVVEAERSPLGPQAVLRAVPDPPRPRLTPFQASFEDTDTWRDQQPVSIEERRVMHRRGLDTARSSLRRGNVDSM